MTVTMTASDYHDHHQQKGVEHLSALPPMPSLSMSVSTSMSLSPKKLPRTKTVTAPLLLWGVLLLFPSYCDCFVSTTVTRIDYNYNTRINAMSVQLRNNNNINNNYDLQDPDMMEMFLGGQRYENVPLPDSMLDTTLFVGNLCEFAQDEDLSQKFRSVTNLQSLPACVARRPSSQSLEYGFVAFPTVEEKEAAIIRFHGVEFMGRRLKVEEICDHPSKGRVNVPEKLVSYVLGVAKRVPRGKKDFSLRKISNNFNRRQQQRRRGDDETICTSNDDRHNNNNSNNNNTQGRRKGDRKQKRANHKKSRRRNRDDQDIFY